MQISRTPQFLSLLLGLLFLLASDAPLSAQAGTASLRAIVRDPTGAVIVGATVVLSREGTPQVKALTNERGEASIAGLPVGAWTLTVSSPGFQVFERPDVVLKAGTNPIDVTLAIEGYIEDLTVARDPRDTSVDPRGDGFSTTLSDRELDALPDDEDEMESTLKEMAGPDAVIAVDGFQGGQLPPKAQIQRIVIRRGVFSAQYHERAGGRIEIVTRPGMTAWRTDTRVSVRDASLNARNAFATAATPSQQRRLSFSLNGPLVKDRTSLAVSVEGLDAYETQTIVAASTAGLVDGLARQPQNRLNVRVSLQQSLSKTHTVRLEYQGRDDAQDNLGVGNFDLPSRAFSRDTAVHTVRFGDSQTIGRRMFNQFRAQGGWRDSASVAASSAPTLRVLDAFTDGGANVAGDTSSTELQIADELEWAWKKHSFVAGALVESARHASTAIRNGAGTFTFGSLADFAAGRPLTYTQRVGDPAVAYAFTESAWFLQDDVRLRKNVTLSLGVRHEWQSHLQAALNLAPRASVLWSPSKSGRTTIRGGGGVFYDWYEASTYEETLQVNGTTLEDISIRNPGYPDPFAGATVQVLDAGRVQQGDLKMPTVRQALAGLEHQLKMGLRVNATYTFRDGTNILRGRNVNAPDANGVRPIAGLGNVIEIESVGRLRAHELALGANGAVPWRRLFVAARYAYGQSFDDGNGPTAVPANSLAPNEWGPAADDVRHRVFLVTSFEPISRVRLSVNMRGTSARPYTITTGFDDNGDTIVNDRPTGVGRNSARGDGAFDLDLRLAYRIGGSGGSGDFGPGGPGGPGGGPGPGGPPPAGEGASAQLGPGGFGGRGGRAGGNQTGPTRSAELYLQVFNALNTVNETGFSGVLTSPFFGLPTAAQPARRVEIGVHVVF
ncbi:MAG: TonB-dependent receptor [Vicinamibacterales bacterium]